MRSIRSQPFCWQEKKILRLLKNKFQKNELVKMKYLYFIITEIDSDFNNKDITYYTKTIHTYSGLSKDWIPTGLKKLQDLNIIQIISEKEKGKFKGKKLIFTPECTFIKTPSKPVHGKPDNGKSFNDSLYTLEHSSLLEHNKELIEHKDKTIREKLKRFSPESRKVEIYFNQTYKKESPEMYKINTKNLIKSRISWRDSFDKLIRIDKKSYDSIIKVIDALFFGNLREFWIDNRNFMSATKLRKKNRNNITYFDFFVLKMGVKNQRTETYNSHLDLSNIEHEDDGEEHVAIVSDELPF